MRVRPEDDKGVDGYLVEVMGLADDAEDDVGQLGRRFEEQPTLQGASGDFDEGIGAADGRTCGARAGGPRDALHSRAIQQPVDITAQTLGPDGLVH